MSGTSIISFCLTYQDCVILLYTVRPTCNCNLSLPPVEFQYWRSHNVTNNSVSAWTFGWTQESFRPPNRTPTESTVPSDTFIKLWKFSWQRLRSDHHDYELAWMGVKKRSCHGSSARRLPIYLSSHRFMQKYYHRINTTWSVLPEVVVIVGGVEARLFCCFDHWSTNTRYPEAAT